MSKFNKFRTSRDLLSTLHSDINQLFYPFMTGDDSSTELDSALSQSSAWSVDWSPAIDIKDDANQYIIHADVPGVAPENIQVSLDNNILTIKGEKASVQKADKENFLRVERAQGTFMRRFSLPETVDGKNIKARSQHGVLEITIPKQKNAGCVEIKVEG